MTISQEKTELVHRLADDWTSGDIRDLAGTLLKLADSVDQRWDASNVHSIFRWPNALSRIERNSLNLAMKARLIYTERQRRRSFVPADFLGEPGWDMLLDLFMQFSGGAKVSVSSLCLASNAPDSTALRYINQLEDHDFIVRASSKFDKRVTFVSLTEKGIIAVGSYLEGS